MKISIVRIFQFLLFFFGAANLFGQSTTKESFPLLPDNATTQVFAKGNEPITATQEGDIDEVSLPVFNTTETDYYIFYTESPEDNANSTQEYKNFYIRCDKYIEFYNSFLRFIPPNEKKDSKSKMEVRLFQTVEEFEKFTGQLGLPQEKDIYALLYHDQGNDSYKIAATLNSIGSKLFRTACFYQFFRSTISGTPPWFEAALYAYLEEERKEVFYPEVYEKTKIRPGEAAVFTNLKQLLEKIGKEQFKKNLISILTGETSFNSYNDLPYVWAAVNFMADNGSPVQYSRVLWDCLKLLESAKSEEENTNTLKAYLENWLKLDKFADATITYIENSITLQQLQKEGKTLYEQGAFDEAGKIFQTILFELPNDYFSLYFTALIRYNEKSYTEALDLLGRAFLAGGNEAMLNYSAGIVYYAMGEPQYAQLCLELAVEMWPGKYSPLAKPILKSIKNMIDNS